MENSETRVTVRKLRLFKIINRLADLERELLTLELRVEDCPELSFRGQMSFGGRIGVARDVIGNTRCRLKCVADGDEAHRDHRASAEEIGPSPLTQDELDFIEQEEKQP